MGYKVAVVGATGAVGREMLKVLEQRSFPADRVLPLASARSAGQTLCCSGRDILVRELTPRSFDGVQIALFSAGGAVSKEFAPLAAEAGAWVIDNTSAFRMEPDVPLVVPEVNPDALAGDLLRRRIIANPNCSTIQMVVALAPLHRAAGIRRVVVSTYQAVSGAGMKAMEELTRQAVAFGRGDSPPSPAVFPHLILFECLPRIGAVRDSGYTVEEEKMIHETRKILDAPDLRISATTVRVPVMIGHSEAVNVELERPLSAEEARKLLSEAEGVELVDEPSADRYPLARDCAGTDPVHVGRVREDRSVDHGLDLWVVADNLRKGAALNAVQIAELLVQRDLA